MLAPAQPHCSFYFPLKQVPFVQNGEAACFAGGNKCPDIGEQFYISLIHGWAAVDSASKITGAKQGGVLPFT